MARSVTFGLCLFGVHPPRHFVECVRQAEGLGFSTLWLADTVLKARDVFCYLTLAAANTTTLTIGPGVLPISTRHFAVGVNAIRTLEELIPGRTLLGYGSGGSGIAELGIRPARIATLKAIVELSRSLLAGGSVTSDAAPGEPLAEAQLRFPDRRAIPIYLAATGSKMLQASGEVAAGILAHVGPAPGSVRYALEQVSAGAANRAGALPAPTVSLYVYCSVSEDRRVIRSECRRGVAALLSRTRTYGELAGVSAEELTALRDASSRGNLEDMLSEDAVYRLSVSGSPRECIEKIEAVVDAGITDITLVPPTGRDLETISLLGQHVLPHFR